MQQPRERRVRVRPDRRRRERDVLGVREAHEPGPQRLGCRQVAGAQHDVGPVGVDERGVAQQRVVVRHGGIAPPAAAQRVGEHRPAGALRHLDDARVAARTRDDDAPPAVLDRDGRLRRRRGDVDPRRAARSPRRGVRTERRRHERLAQREVEMHGPGSRRRRRTHRAAGQHAHPPRPARASPGGCRPPRTTAPIARRARSGRWPGPRRPHAAPAGGRRSARGAARRPRAPRRRPAGSSPPPSRTCTRARRDDRSPSPRRARRTPRSARRRGTSRAAARRG